MRDSHDMCLALPENNRMERLHMHGIVKSYLLYWCYWTCHQEMIVLECAKPEEWLVWHSCLVLLVSNLYLSFYHFPLVSSQCYYLINFKWVNYLYTLNKKGWKTYPNWLFHCKTTLGLLINQIALRFLIHTLIAYIKPNSTKFTSLAWDSWSWSNVISMNKVHPTG